MEGKKSTGLCQDCRAVSEVYGQLLMISIVVLAFSMIGLTVFSDHGAVKPEHIPHTDLQENFNRSSNTVQIVHSGGEAIDLSAIKITFSVNGQESAKPPLVSPFTVKNPDGSPSSDGVFTLGDCIEISTKGVVPDSTSPKGVRDPTSWDTIEMFFIDTPSQQVIQKAVLQRGPGKVPNWITPHPYGSVYSDSADNGGRQPTESVAEIKDWLLTDSQIPQSGLVTENYTFGIDADAMGISNSFNRVILRIIYQTHDYKNANTLTLRIFDGSQWILIAPQTASTPQTILPQYSNIQDCLNRNAAEYSGDTTYDISKYVKTTNQLEKLEVSFSLRGDPSNRDPAEWVDFVGIHVD